MDASQTTDTPSEHRILLELSQAFATHLQPVRQNLLAELAPRLAPYQVDFQLSGTRLECVGNKGAVQILQRLIEAGGTAWDEGTDPATLWSPDAVTATIQDTLGRDLAFRVPGLRNAVRPKSVMQHAFMSAMLAKAPPLLIGLGATGTGKTHLALAAGINLVEEGRFRRLIIARPHFAEPGEVGAKSTRTDALLDTPFAAIEDELNDLIGSDEVRRLQDTRRLEIMPVSAMRGRTFRNAFILIDEAQNLNVRTTRMAVTRLGQNSRIVLTGDPGHADLPQGETSGLTHLIGLVEPSDIARIFRFTTRQIVRDPVVATLEALYEAETARPAA